MASFVAENIKTLVHIRQRLHRDNKLGLCLGAGVSVDLFFPTWPRLLERISEHPEIQGQGLLQVSESLTSQSQFLFQRYKQSLADNGRTTGDEIIDYRQASLGWLQIVHQCLYYGAQTKDDDLRSHPYLWNLLPLIKQSSLTINYNFDDTVERMLYAYNNTIGAPSDDRGFEVAWQPSAQFRRQKGVIYHPNGFLPFRLSEGFSNQIIFMEQEFADQLIDVGEGHYTCLLNHFSQQTIIFLGISLSDATLKHLLRLTARNNPGHFHYHIHWCRDGKPPLAEQTAIRQANFSVYNLVTLFLTTDEISDFSNLITSSNESFLNECDKEQQGVNTNYRYYVTGVVGTGKTTALNHIRCVDSFDEWVDRKHQLLSKPHEELSPEERTSVDDWINQQFRKKNRRISNPDIGLVLVDRSPIDPLYFVKDKTAERKRAQELLDWMVPPNSTVQKIAPGHLIILNCDIAVLKTRLASRDKKYTIEQLESQQTIVSKFWDQYSQATIIDTTNMSIAQVIKKILQIILFGGYQEIEFQDVCKNKAE